MKWAFLFHLLLACLFSPTMAQLETTTDALGETIVVSFTTDQLGDTLGTSVLSTIVSSSKQGTSLTQPTQTGTALPPFSSLVVSSGTIIAYSDYTHTGLPSNFPKKGSAHQSANPLNDLSGFIGPAIAILGGLIGAIVLL